MAIVDSGAHRDYPNAVCIRALRTAYRTYVKKKSRPIQAALTLVCFQFLAVELDHAPELAHEIDSLDGHERYH